jgi:hypothetical protein
VPSPHDPDDGSGPFLYSETYDGTVAPGTYIQPGELVVSLHDPAIGAVGSGLVDDSAALAAALATGKQVVGQPGKTYRIDTALVIGVAGTILDLNGATIKKGAALNADALTVTAPNVIVRNGFLDGNRSAGAGGGGISWQGANGRLVNFTTKSNKLAGVTATGAGTLLKCQGCTSDDNVSGVFSGDGFLAQGGAILRTDSSCSAEGNDRAGFFVYVTAGKCRINGYAARNTRYGVWIMADGGTSGYIECVDNDFGNLLVSKQTPAVGPQDWRFGTVIVIDQGKTAGQTSGAGVGLYGIKRCQFGTIISRGGNGWAVVLAYGAPGGPGCEYNSFGTILADATGSADSDPAVSLQSSSRWNDFGHISATGFSYALIFSEEYTPGNNDYNTFDSVVAKSCTVGAVKFMAGSYNVINSLVSRDCLTTVTALGLGLVEFKAHPVLGGGQCKGNVIRWLDHKDTRTDATVPATSIIHAESTESGNSVIDGVARGAYTDIIDEGTNQFSLRPMGRLTQLEAFETGVTGGADNSTAGQFIEGTKGRRIAGSAAYTTLSKTVALDLSAMAADESFRIFFYVENVADKKTSGSGAALLRFQTSGGNYYQFGIPASVFAKNGPMFFMARKGSAVVVGSPSWASITLLQVFVGSAGANTFALTADDLVRLDPTRSTTHLDATTPFGGATGSVRTATGKLWTNDAGTWKSVAVT